VQGKKKIDYGVLNTQALLLLASRPDFVLHLQYSKLDFHLARRRRQPGLGEAYIIIE